MHWTTQDSWYSRRKRTLTIWSFGPCSLQFTGKDVFGIPLSSSQVGEHSSSNGTPWVPRTQFIHACVTCKLAPFSGVIHSIWLFLYFSLFHLECSHPKGFPGHTTDFDAGVNTLLLSPDKNDDQWNNGASFQGSVVQKEGNPDERFRERPSWTKYDFCRVSRNHESRPPEFEWSKTTETR